MQSNEHHRLHDLKDEEKEHDPLLSAAEDNEGCFYTFTSGEIRDAI